MCGCLSLSSSSLPSTSTALLLPDNQDDKRARLHFWTLLRWGGRLEIGGRKKDVVCFLVDRHSACVVLSRTIVLGRERVRSVCLYDGESSSAVGRKGIVCVRIKSVGVDPFADGWRSDDFP